MSARTSAKVELAMTRTHLTSLFVLLALLAGGSAMAQKGFVTVSDQNVGPGMRYRKMVDTATPWSLDLFEADLTNPYLLLESCKGHEILRRWQVSSGSREATSSMARRNQRAGHRVVAAINADFFNTAPYTGEPVNIQVERGEMVCMPIDRSTIGFTPENRPLLERYTFTGYALHRDTTARIDRVNAGRGTDMLVLFNRFFADSTRTNAWGAEALLTPLSGWMMNDTVACRVEAVELYKGGMPIPDDKVVLSGHGRSIPFVTALQPGDTVRIALHLPQTRARVKEVVGGFTRIVHDGANYALRGYAEEGGSSTFATDRHPRTAVGFNQDSTRLMLVVVDGRQQDLSIGMNLIELADFMISQGCHEAVNLDGGGSSTMVIRDQVVNSPSDGWERYVANALLVISTAPQREAIRLELVPHTLRILEGESVAFRMAALDTFVNIISAAPADFTLSVAGSFGTITPQGRFTAGTARDSGYVHFNYQGVHDSVFVAVKTLEKLSLLPATAVVDTAGSIQFSVESLDSDGLDPHPSLSWQVTDPAIGMVDQNGHFTPRAIGETLVIIRAAGLADTARVTVAVYSGTHQLEGMEKMEGWSLNGQNLDSVNCRLTLAGDFVTEGDYALRADYQFTFNPAYDNWLYLEAELPIGGVPDSIIVDIRTDSTVHAAYLFAADDNGELFRYVPRRNLREAGSWNTIGVATAQPLPESAGSIYHFPITLVRIGIKLKGERVAGKICRGTLYFDNLRVTYPVKSGVTAPPPQGQPQEFRLLQNYPNPFNGETRIFFYNDKPRNIQLVVFDRLGREVARLFDGPLEPGGHEFPFWAGDLATGLYFLRCEPGLAVPVRMTLLR